METTLVPVRRNSGGVRGGPGRVGLSFGPSVLRVMASGTPNCFDGKPFAIYQREQSGGCLVPDAGAASRVLEV